MILQALNALYDRLAADPEYEIPEPGYSLQKITFRVVLQPDGALHAIEDARLGDDGRLRPRLVLVPGRAKPSGSGINPCLLWDNAGYMLGFKPDDTNPERTRETWEAFRDRHLSLESEVDARAFSAVCRFLEAWDPRKAAEHPALTDAAKTGFGVFQIRGESRYVHEHPAVRDWWAGQRAGESGDEETGQCLVTGNEGALARLHPKIKGVRGAQSSGATIVSFNEDAYESYGKSQSYNAPVSEDVAFRYVTALNALLRRRDKHRLQLADTTVVFWTERPSLTEDIFATFMSEGSRAAEPEAAQDEGLRQKLEAFLRALKEGRERYGEVEEDPQKTSFYILGLAPNAARISVRFFHRGTVAELLDNLRRHHDDIGVARRTWGHGRSDPELPPAWLLLRQTARQPADVPPLLSGPLLRAVIAGTSYPDALYHAVLRRIRADAAVDYLRACVLKGYLNRNLDREVSVSLDHDRPDPAYRLGRLFAALEKTQKDALGAQLSATIRDRYYSSASATPGSVFPRLLRTYQHHLAKLQGGLRTNREKLVQEIVAPLETFPGHLDLADQGLFAIGYYHQTRDFYTKREETDSD